MTAFGDLLSSKFTSYALHEGVYINKNSNTQYYTGNFGLQWNTFSETQLDSHTKLLKSAYRLFGCSGWSPASLKEMTVLEVGSGAGRFTEVLLKHGARVVSIEPSDAIFANQAKNKHPNLLLIKERLELAPIKPLAFDYVLCYGVIQHTPNPEQSYKECLKYVKPDGMCSFDHYEKICYPAPWYFPKYFWRPITTRLKPEFLLKIISTYIPYYFPIDTFIKSLPLMGFTISGLIPIPCWNYTGTKDVNQSRESLIEWAIMDTFDALGAKYDIPWSLNRLRRFAKKLPVKSFHVGLGGNGIILNTYGNTTNPEACTFANRNPANTSI